MTQYNEKTAPEVTASETAMSIAERSTTTAYLLYSRDNSEGVYRTHGGAKLPITDYRAILVPASFIYSSEPTRMILSPDETLAYSRAMRKKIEEDLAKDRQALERQIRADLECEYKEQLEELDGQAQKIYEPLYAEMDARLNEALLEWGVNPDDPY